MKQFMTLDQIGEWFKGDAAQGDVPRRIEDRLGEAQKAVMNHRLFHTPQHRHRLGACRRSCSLARAADFFPDRARMVVTHLAARAGRLEQYGLHATVGYYLLLLIALRLVWRLGTRSRDPSRGAPAVAASRRAQRPLAVYFLMFSSRFREWNVADTLGQPIEATLFGFIPVPHLLDASTPPVPRPHRGNPRGSHRYVLLALVVVHFGAR